MNGEDISGKPGHISYMLQKDLLLPYKTIEDNVALPLFIKGERKKEARIKVGAFFEQFGLEGTQKKISAPAFRGDAAKSSAASDIHVFKRRSTSRRAI